MSLSNFENMDFTKISNHIRTKKGKISDEIMDLALYKAYEIAPIIFVSKARKMYNFNIDMEDARDLGVDAYIATKKNFSPEKPPHDINGYLNMVIKNMIVDYIKSKMKDKLSFDALKEKIIGTENITESNLYDKLITVKEALRKLKPFCRKILYMAGEKYKIQEMIDKTGMSINQAAMRQRLRECRKQLGRMVGGYGDEI